MEFFDKKSLLKYYKSGNCYTDEEILETIEVCGSYPINCLYIHNKFIEELDNGKNLNNIEIEGDEDGADESRDGESSDNDKHDSGSNSLFGVISRLSMSEHEKKFDGMTLIGVINLIVKNGEEYMKCKLDESRIPRGHVIIIMKEFIKLAKIWEKRKRHKYHREADIEFNKLTYFVLPTECKHCDEPSDEWSGHLSD